jgi:hypothetical protein
VVTRYFVRFVTNDYFEAWYSLLSNHYLNYIYIYKGRGLGPKNPGVSGLEKVPGVFGVGDPGVESLLTGERPTFHRSSISP